MTTVSIPGDFLQFSPSFVAEVERNFAVLDLPQRRSTRLFIGTTATTTAAATTTATTTAATGTLLILIICALVITVVIQRRKVKVLKSKEEPKQKDVDAGEELENGCFGTVCKGTLKDSREVD